MSRRYAEVRFGGPKSVFEFDSDFAIYYRWFRQFFRVGSGSLSLHLQLHVDEFYF